MTCTKSRRSRPLLLLGLACILSMSGCKTASEMRAPPLLKPEAPEVRCVQPAAPTAPVEPRADEWIEWNPPRPGREAGEARMSERAVNWIISVLNVLRISEGLRAAEHACLEQMVEKGLIRL